jgi:hypothetical protein
MLAEALPFLTRRYVFCLLKYCIFAVSSPMPELRLTANLAS